MAKTAFVWESVEVEQRVVPSDVLRAFHALQSPSIRQMVWIGRYLGDGIGPHPMWATGGRLPGRPVERPDDLEDSDAYLVAFVIGQLAGVVFGHLLMPGVEWHFPRRLAAKLMQIWPPVHEVIKWPPERALSAADMDAIVRSMGGPEPPQESGP